MKLIERYLAAIRRDLPRGRADDIVAELRDELSERLAAGEEALGHAAGVAEERALIREFGHPLLVAGRFRTRQHLIGPEAYPFFLFTVRIVFGVVIAFALALVLLGFAAAPHEQAQRVGQAVGDATVTLLAVFGGLVLIFAQLERAGFPAKHLAQWKPDRLPASEHQPPSWQAPCEAAMGAALMLWWSGLVDLSALTSSAAVRVSAAPVWDMLYWPVLALLAARVLIALGKWQRPGRALWTLLDIASALFTLVLLALAYRAGEWVVLTPAAGPADAVAGLKASIDLALKIALPVTGVTLLIGILRDARNWLRGMAAP